MTSPVPFVGYCLRRVDINSPSREDSPIERAWWYVFHYYRPTPAIIKELYPTGFLPSLPPPTHNMRLLLHVEVGTLSQTLNNQLMALSAAVDVLDVI